MCVLVRWGAWMRVSGLCGSTLHGAEQEGCGGQACMPRAGFQVRCMRACARLHALLNRTCLPILSKSTTMRSNGPPLQVVVDATPTQEGGPDQMATDAPEPTTTTAPSAPDAAATAAPSALDAPPSSTPPTPRSPPSYASKVLMKFLLRTIAVSSYSPNGPVLARAHDADTHLLYKCLRTMFEGADLFGGSLFALAASVVTDQVHHDPLCFRALDEAGLPEAFLAAVKVGVGMHGCCSWAWCAWANLFEVHVCASTTASTRTSPLCAASLVETLTPQLCIT